MHKDLYSTALLTDFGEVRFPGNLDHPAVHRERQDSTAVHREIRDSATVRPERRDCPVGHPGIQGTVVF